MEGIMQGIVSVRGPPLPDLHARRCYQQAGQLEITCLKCGKEEEPGAKFKKCGKCEDVCYCSRECQKAHWKEHKKECQPTLKNTIDDMLQEMRQK